MGDVIKKSKNVAGEKHAMCHQWLLTKWSQQPSLQIPENKVEILESSCIMYFLFIMIKAKTKQKSWLSECGFNIKTFWVASIIRKIKDWVLGAALHDFISSERV